MSFINLICSLYVVDDLIRRTLLNVVVFFITHPPLVIDLLIPGTSNGLVSLAPYITWYALLTKEIPISPRALYTG